MALSVEIVKQTEHGAEVLHRVKVKMNKQTKISYLIRTQKSGRHHLYTIQQGKKGVKELRMELFFYFEIRFVLVHVVTYKYAARG